MKTGVGNAEGGGQKGIMEEKTLPVVSSSWEATGVFRAATGVAAAPLRGANPPFATEDGTTN